MSIEDDTTNKYRGIQTASNVMVFKKIMAIQVIYATSHVMMSVYEVKCIVNF